MRKAHPPLEVWQFDEVLGQCGTDSTYREFVGGVLAGLALGRPELGDRPQKGIVWVAQTAMTRLPHLAIDSAVQAFWEDLDRATLFLVGEEYPPFRGDPAAAAQRFADTQQALSSGGPIRKSLAQRYIAGMTPGWHAKAGSPPKDLGLGGNLDSKPDPFVSTWRTGFIDGRIRAHQPSGFRNSTSSLKTPSPITHGTRCSHSTTQRTNTGDSSATSGRSGKAGPSGSILARGRAATVSPG